MTAQPVGIAFHVHQRGYEAAADPSVSNRIQGGDGCYRRVPTCRD